MGKYDPGASIEDSLPGDIIGAEGGEAGGYDQWSCPDLPAQRGIALYATLGAYAICRDALRADSDASGLQAMPSESEGRHRDSWHSGAQSPRLSSPFRATISVDNGPGGAAGGWT